MDATSTVHKNRTDIHSVSIVILENSTVNRSEIVIIERIFMTLLVTEHWAIDKLMSVLGCHSYTVTE